jgi:hypothetical protein
MDLEKAKVKEQERVWASPRVLAKEWKPLEWAMACKLMVSETE